MPDIDPIEVAHGLMLDKARSVTALEVRNELGDLVAIGALTASEYEALVTQVLDEIQTADIEIGGA